MRGRSCPPHYRLLRAASCSRENRSTPLFPTRRVLSGCAALPSPFRLHATSSPDSRRVSTIFESRVENLVENYPARLYGSNSFLWRERGEDGRGCSIVSSEKSLRAKGLSKAVSSDIFFFEFFEIFEQLQKRLSTLLTLSIERIGRLKIKMLIFLRWFRRNLYAAGRDCRSF